MPAAIAPISAQRHGEYVILEAVLPQRPPSNIGVLLVDPVTGRGWVRMREYFDDIADPEDAEVLEALEPDIRDRLSGASAVACLAHFEDSLSNAIRVSERQSVAVDAFTRVLDRLYDEHVETTGVLRYETHLPLYSLRAAAGHLGEEMQSEAEDWVRAPQGMRLSKDLFVAHVVGRSMEPRIPDGSLNLFRFNPAGSRQNKILLIQRFGVLDETARYTVKQYNSHKVYIEAEERWEHDWILLKPLNLEFEAWELRPDEFAVVAEWLRVID